MSYKFGKTVAFDGEESNNDEQLGFDPEKVTPEFESSSTENVTLSQAQLSAIIGKVRKQFRNQTVDLAKKVEDATSKLNLTAQEREKLEKSLVAVRSSYESEADRIKNELQDARTAYERLQKSSTEEVAQWKEKFHSTRMDVDVAAACNAANVVQPYGPRQVRAQLATALTVEEVVSSDGKSTGEFRTVVRTKNAEGEPIFMPVLDYLKQMDDSGENPNLFEHSLKRGTESGNSGGSGESIPTDPKALYEYMQDKERRAALLARSANVRGKS